MITIDATTAPAPAERYALDLLVDLARLLPTAADADGSCASAVRIGASDGGAGAWTPAERPVDGVFEVAPGRVSVPRRVLRDVTAIAAAAAEQGSARHDRFGRVPSAENRLVARGTERDAPLSRLAIALRQAVVRAAEQRPVFLLEPWPEGRRWGAALSHDLDVVAAWPLFTGLRLVELLKRGNAGDALRVLGAAAGRVLGAPVFDGVRTLLETEARAGVGSTWFILCGTPTLATFRAGDLTYRPESAAARRILAAVGGAGHEFGLHGSFATFDAPNVFGEQRRHLQALTAAPVCGVRQHFLRFRFMDTAHAMHGAGFAFDSSIGFADRNGFRLGAADVVPLWDVARGAPAEVEEAPFAWMDRALSKYRGIESPDAWVADAMELARTTREVEGAWVGIWHPNLTPALGYPGAPEAYRALVHGLLDMDPWMGPMRDLVAWRRTRREARAVAVRPGGPVLVRQVAPPCGHAPRPGLETPDGRPVASAPA